MTLLRIFRLAAVAAAMTGMSGAAVQAQDSVLRMARGAASQDVDVEVNRAVVLEAIQPFAEVSVANPGIADVAALSNTSIYILGKRWGRTTLTLLGENGRLIANVIVKVGPDLSELKDLYAEILPGERIEVRTANDGLVLSGTVSSAGRLARALELAQRFAPGRISNMMSVGGSQQVMLKVRFAEVTRSVGKQLGFNWGFGFTSGNLYGAAETADYLSGSNAPGNIVDGDGETSYATQGGNVGASDGVFSLGWATGGFIAELTIDALETKGLARTLAEPTLIALSGDAAQFLAGGEYPIPVIGTDGSVGITYRPYGVSLGFTPIVLDDELINLEIAAESSNIDTTVSVSSGTGLSYNGISVRRARTTIELKDGQSFAIAGMLEDRFVDNAQQIPWIGDVPVLGTLFRSSDFSTGQTELVIMVTVHLVSPTTADALTTPIDRMTIPREEELFLLGRLEGGRDSILSDVATQNFQGAYGYVME